VADGGDVAWDRLERGARGEEQKLVSQLRRLARRQGPSGKAVTPAVRDNTLRSATLAVGAFATAQSFLGILAGLTGCLMGAQMALPASQHPAIVTVFALSGAVLLTGGRENPQAGALGSFFSLVASAFAISLLGGSARAIHAPAWVSRGANMFALDAFLPAVLLSFVTEFPRLPGFVRSQKISRRLCLVAWLLGVALCAANCALTMSPAMFLPAIGFLDRRRPLRSLYWVITLGSTLAALALAFWKSRGALGDERSRAGWLVVAIVVGSAPMVLASLMGAGGSPWQSWVASHQTVIRDVVYLFLLTIPVSTACLVKAHRVWEVQPRRVAYVLARSFAAAISVAPLLVLLPWVYVGADESIDELLRNHDFVMVVAWAIVGLALLPFQRRLACWLRYRLFEEKPDVGTSLSALARIGGQGLSATDVIMATREEIERALRPLRADILMWSTAFDGYVPVATGHEQGLSGSSAIAAIAADARAPVLMDGEAPRSATRLLPEEERQWLIDRGCRLIVPFQGTHGLPVALGVLGPKRSGLAYSRTDCRYLRGVAPTAAELLERRLDEGKPFDTRASGSANRGDEAARECDRCGAIAEEGDRCPCGGRLVPAHIPSLLSGKFRIERRIGRGGMGVVYRARDIALDRDVAIKLLPGAVSTTGSLRMRSEARAMATLSHPHLAVVFGLETWRGVALLVMEHLHGGTLAARLRQGTLAPARVVDIGVALVDALECMHRAGLLHRDIKPSNIGFESEVPKLIDFGLAQILTATSPEEGHSRLLPPEIVGTAAYLPPEALTQRIADPAWDLWGLALVLYEAVTGVNPLLGSDLTETMGRISHAKIPDARRLAPGCPGPLATFFEHALSPHRGDRPRSTSAFRSALMAARPDPSPGSRCEPIGGPAGRIGDCPV
jgi:hypothetical protein